MTYRMSGTDTRQIIPGTRPCIAQQHSAFYWTSQGARMIEQLLQASKTPFAAYQVCGNLTHARTAHVLQGILSGTAWMCVMGTISMVQGAPTCERPGAPGDALAERLAGKVDRQRVGSHGRDEHGAADGARLEAGLHQVGAQLLLGAIRLFGQRAGSAPGTLSSSLVNNNHPNVSACSVAQEPVHAHCTLRQIPILAGPQSS